MALTAAQHYIDEARRLIQDEVAPYRYSDASMLDALHLGMLELKRLRPEVFFGTSIPGTSTVGSTITIDESCQTALVYFLAGHVQLNDDEPSQDQRGAAFINKFNSSLTKVGG